MKSFDLVYENNKNIIQSFYYEKGLIHFFEKDNNYLQKSFEEINRIWLDNLMRIEKINYILIAEAPLWGNDKKYFYNPESKISQFFYKSDLEEILNIKIKDKKEFINICNTIGLVILDISPFPLNPKETKINYRKIGKANYRSIVEATLPFYFEKKALLLKPKISENTKVLFRYKRVKDNFEAIVTKVLFNNHIINSTNLIVDISQKGGGINKSRLKQLLSLGSYPTNRLKP